MKYKIATHCAKVYNENAREYQQRQLDKGGL